MEKETVKNVGEKEPEEIPTEGVKVIPSKSYLRNVIARSIMVRLSRQKFGRKLVSQIFPSYFVTLLVLPE